MGLTTTAAARRISLRRKVIYALLPLLLVYGVAEAVATALYLRGDLEPVSIWVLEDSGKGSTIQFDPVLGYKLTSTPTRMACIATNGVVESVGTVRGNNHGFPDRDDFSLRKTDPQVTRLAVFGDSFSAAQFLEVNWPDRCEDLAAQAGKSIELLNFSIDGGGHTNWWRTLRGFVEERDCELDGVLFAVYANDLRRPFVIWDDQVIQQEADGTRTIAFGTVWNQRLPQTLAEARPHFHGLPRWQVHPTDTLERMLRGDLRPRDNRDGIYLTRRLLRTIFGKAAPPRQYTLEDVQNYDLFADPTRLTMWSDMRDCLVARQLPVLVVDVPGIDLLLQESGPSAEAEVFAKFLGARFINGAEAYEGLGQEEIRAGWLPYDGHWGQAGSDRFAEFMLRVLSDWPTSNEDTAQAVPESP